jgi:CheY-like chemotaxis protein
MDVFRREEHVLAWLKQAGLRVSESSLPRLVFTTGNPCRATDAFRLGAVDYLLKPLEAEQVTQAVNRDRVRRYHNAQMEDLGLRYESLTPRERQVMHRVVSGLLNKQAAAELGTSEIRNAYVEGIGSAFDPMKPFWAKRNAETEEPVRALLTSETTAFQYTHGAKNVKQISPDNWTFDQIFLDRPGNAAIQLDLLYDYQSNLGHYDSWHEDFRTSQPPMLIL